MKKIESDSPDRHRAAVALSPAEFLHGEAGVPDLGHVNDLVPIELHDIDVVSAGVTAGRRNRAALTSMRAMEHAVGGNIVPRRVCRERLTS